MKQWQSWFAWYPVYTFKLGWVWLRTVSRKQIPEGYVTQQLNPPLGQLLSEAFTKCWYRIPEEGVGG